MNQPFTPTDTVINAWAEDTPVETLQQELLKLSYNVPLTVLTQMYADLNTVYLKSLN